MVSAPASGSNGLGLSPLLTRYIVFLSFRVTVILFMVKTLYSHSASLHPAIEISTGKVKARGSPVMNENLIQGGVEILIVALCT